MDVRMTANRPSPEQVERIRQLSRAVLGDAGAAFLKWGYPSTRSDASDLLRRINESRRGRTVDDEEPIAIEEITDMKTCSTCGESKQPADFGRVTANRDGLSYSCKACAKKRYQAKKSDPRAEVLPAEPTPEGEGWHRVFVDPTLTELERIQYAFGIPTLDDTARVCRLIAAAL